MTSSGPVLRRGLKWTNFNYLLAFFSCVWVNALSMENAKYWLSFSPLVFVFSYTWSGCFQCNNSHGHFCEKTESCRRCNCVLCVFARKRETKFSKLKAFVCLMFRTENRREISLFRNALWYSLDVIERQTEVHLTSNYFFFSIEGKNCDARLTSFYRPLRGKNKIRRSCTAKKSVCVGTGGVSDKRK